MEIKVCAVTCPKQICRYKCLCIIGLYYIIYWRLYNFTWYLF